jgi:hypothetical protein
MRKNQTVVLSGLILLGLAGLALSQDKVAAPPSSKPVQTKPAPSSAPAPTAARQGDYPVIGYLEKQDHTITIKSGPKGTLYSVKTTDGKKLLENVTLDQVRAQAPELHEFLKTAVAGNSGVKTDASVRIKFDSSAR